ncbi:MAG: hypothetical protein ACRDNX_12525, partial [Gaiellaceae bacterium]
IPVGSIPVGSIPVGSIGLNSVPVGSINLGDVLLSSLPIDWDPILPDALDDRPLQTLTLADVYANTTARENFEALTFADSGLAQSLLSGVSLSAIMLGEKKLSQIPPPGASTWCGAIVQAGGVCNGVSTGTNTVLGLSVAGLPVGSIPVGSIVLSQIAGGIAGTPVGSIPVGSIDIAATRLASIKLDFANADTVVDCPARIACTSANTLGDAAALSPSAIRAGAKLSDLQAVLGNVTLNEIIIGTLPRASLAWEGFPIDGLQLYSGIGQKLQYHVDFDLNCSKKAGLAATVKLPDGFIYDPGSTTFEYGNGAPVAGANPTTTAKAGARWSVFPGDPCGALATQHIRINFKALSSFNLGIETASARVSSAGGVETADDQAPVQVLQNWEGNDEPETAQTIVPNQLIVGHVARSGDRELFKVAIPARDTRTTIYLSHIPAGADFDLVVGKPATQSLQSNPVGSIPVGSIPVEDNGSAPNDFTRALPPETLQDIPVGSIPVGSISANRGNADEVAQLVSQGESGFYTIAVSGYNGSHSEEPFVLRVKQDAPAALPPCPARTFAGAAGTPSSLPASLPGDTKTLFLVNRTRLNALHNDSGATSSMLTTLNGLLTRPEIRGQVLEVDGSAAVRAAYSAWDASPCSIGAANDIVRAINDVVAGYRPSLPSLRYVVLLGTDEAIPFARVLDEVEISPESDEAADLAFTLGSPPRANAIYAAAARSHFLTDNAYGAFTEIPWLGRQLYLPQISVSRLLETPDDIERQLKVYDAANGVLDPNSAFTTAYDFLKDGGEGVKSALDLLVPGASTGEINDAWTAATVTGKFAAPADVMSVNAHYSHWLLQPAAGSALVRTGDLPAPPAPPA